jgi:hypothetical protein
MKAGKIHSHHKTITMSDKYLNNKVHTESGHIYDFVTPHYFKDNDEIVEGVDWESGQEPYTHRVVAYAAKIPPIKKNNNHEQ